MDPTPSNAVPITPSFWVAFQRFSESLRLHWDRVFIRYSGRDQLTIIHHLREGSDSARDVLGQWISTLGSTYAQFVRTWLIRAQTAHRSIVWTVILLTAISVACLIALVSHRWPYGRSVQHPTTRTQHQIVQVYRKMLDLSVQRGIRITASTTPTEVARLVSEKWADAGSLVARLTAVYCRARFGVDPLSGEELRAAVEDLGMLKRLARISR